MNLERMHAANDDGVSYADGDVVYGGEPVDEMVPPNQIMTLWSPKLCDVLEVKHEPAPLSLTNVSRTKDCDDVTLNQAVISDVNHYVGEDYPTFLS